MSAETSEWLNTNTLIGFTDKRGNAWHYREEDQGAEPNHYPEAIPVADVLRRLFDFEVVEAPLSIDFNGEARVLSNRKAMVCSDTGECLGIFKDGYKGHQYKDWLLDNVSQILDADLGIGSAGLLRNRGQAFVQVEVPESITTPEGVEFRPNLLACTSFDGSLATTYKRVVTVTVCDNTLSAALSETGQTYKVKHSRYSDAKIGNAREALAIVHTMGEEFAKEIKRLTSWKVTEAQFMSLLNQMVPEKDAEKDSKRGATVADKKREELLHLYRADERCAPWKGTAFGVLQAYNTWRHHTAQVRKGAPRIVRNMEAVVTDKSQNADKELLTLLGDLTGRTPQGRKVKAEVKVAA